MSNYTGRGPFGSSDEPKIEDHLVDLLDGTASDAVLDLVAGSDEHRDARFEAEQAAAVAAEAGADFVLPPDFEARLLAAHDARVPSHALASASNAAPSSDAPAIGAPDSDAATDERLTQPPITQPLGSALAAPLASSTPLATFTGTQIDFAPLAPAPSSGQGATLEPSARTPLPAVRSGHTELDIPALRRSEPAGGAANASAPVPSPTRTEASRTLTSEAESLGSSLGAGPTAPGVSSGYHDSSVGSRTAARDSGAAQSASTESRKESTRQSESAAPGRSVAERRGASDARPQAASALTRRRRALYWGGGGVLALAAAAAITLVSLKQKTPEAGSLAGWHGSVDQALGTGLQVCDAQGQSCASADTKAAVAAGGMIRTDSKTQARLSLSDGSELTLDRSTEVLLVAGEPRHARLLSGRLAADVAKLEGKLARIELPRGQVEVLGTKFALATTGKTASVDVSRGAVKLMDELGRHVVVQAGEEGRLEEGIPPYASSAPTLGEAIAWSDLQTPTEKEQHDVRGLGELRAKKPGETSERKGAVRLTSHQLKVRVVGQIARTEVEEVFSNETDDVLEGIFRFPVPPDAKIERLALEVDGRLEEGAFVDRDRAAAIWRGTIVNAAPKLRRQIRDEIVWVPGPWKDPALLEWQRGGRFELRVFPIPKRGSRRVILAYTQVLKPSGGVRRYIYPLAHDPSGTTEVDRFAMDIQVRGHDPQFGVRTVGYELSNETGGAESARRSFEATKFRPSGDLVLEYALPNRDQELTAWTYKPSAEDLSKDAATPATAAATGSAHDAGYVAIALRPKLPRNLEGAQRDFALVVDSSRSMFGERYERASALASRLIRELDGNDRVTVLACDTTCRSMAGGMLSPGAESAAAATRFLQAEPPEGGSDVGAAIDAARQSVPADPSRSLRVVYIGDGTPTVGAIRPAYVERWVQRSIPSGQGTVTAVAIGTDSDLDTLGAMTRGGGGVVLPFVPGQRLSEAAFAVLGATYGSSLSDVSVELPPNLTEVAPKRLDSIVAGGEQLVVARMAGDRVTGSVILRGKVGGKDFEQRYPIDLTATSDRGNTFVPRLFAATKIADLEQETGDEAKKRAVALSQRFDVASRFTSLLVLESAAMFKAFGLDNSRALPDWSGEEDATATGADGELALDDADSAGQELPAPSAAPGGFGLGGLGSGGGGLAEKKAEAPAPQSAAPSPTGAPGRSAAKPSPPRDLRNPWDERESWSRPRPRRMVPMRRVFERTATIATDSLVPSSATPDKIAEVDREVQLDGNRRESVKKLYNLLALSGNLERARLVAEQWSDKDPLDPEALTARADLLAQTGQRDRAIRLLGSVVDVSPGDVAGQQRLARLQRWAGRPDQGCRFSLAIAQIKSDDVKLLGEAVACARQTGLSWLAERMLDASSTQTRGAAERLASATPAQDKLSGDFRVEATWSGVDTDLDLALLHPDGHRVSWLGAPTRSVITASDVMSTSREGLALRGAKPGDYVLEIVRARGSGPVSGVVTVTVAGTKKQVPFTLDGERRTLGLVKLSLRSRLVPVSGGWRGWR